MSDFLDLIKNRKTTYEFSSKKVKGEFIKRVLEAGRWAPSARNCQNWDFILIKSKKVIGELLDNCYYGEFHEAPPVMIAIVLKPLSEQLSGDLRVLADYHKYLNVSLPALNMCLEATSLGVDSFISSPIISKANKLLGVTKPNKVVLLVGLGYEREGAFKRKRVRRKMSDLLSREVYGSK